MERTLTTFAPGATTSEIRGARVFGLPSLKVQLIDPAIAVADEHLFLSLTTPALERVLTQGASSTTLAGTSAFAPALTAWNEDAAVFGYIDTRAVFERVYNAMRPVVIFGAAMMPGVAQAVDIEKLPETDTISKHLGPIVYTQKAEDDGWMIRSSGPLTLYEACGFLAAGAGASAGTRAFGR